jgi:vitamin uptake sensor VUPS-like protein
MESCSRSQDQRALGFEIVQRIRRLSRNTIGQSASSVIWRSTYGFFFYGIDLNQPSIAKATGRRYMGNNLLLWLFSILSTFLVTRTIGPSAIRSFRDHEFELRNRVRTGPAFSWFLRGLQTRIANRHYLGIVLLAAIVAILQPVLHILTSAAENEISPGWLLNGGVLIYPLALALLLFAYIAGSARVYRIMCVVVIAANIVTLALTCLIRNRWLNVPSMGLEQLWSGNATWTTLLGSLLQLAEALMMLFIYGYLIRLRLQPFIRLFITLFAALFFDSVAFSWVLVSFPSRPEHPPHFGPILVVQLVNGLISAGISAFCLARYINTQGLEEASRSPAPPAGFLASAFPELVDLRPLVVRGRRAISGSLGPGFELGMKRNGKFVDRICTDVHYRWKQFWLAKPMEQKSRSLDAKIRTFRLLLKNDSDRAKTIALADLAHGDLEWQAELVTMCEEISFDSAIARQHLVPLLFQFASHFSQCGTDPPTEWRYCALAAAFRQIAECAAANQASQLACFIRSPDLRLSQMAASAARTILAVETGSDIADLESLRCAIRESLDRDLSKRESLSPTVIAHVASLFEAAIMLFRPDDVLDFSNRFVQRAKGRQKEFVSKRIREMADSPHFHHDGLRDKNLDACLAILVQTHSQSTSR